MTEWQPMETEPRDGAFRLYRLVVMHRSKNDSWPEVHYLSQDDDGYMRETSGDIAGWAYEDFDYWAEAPTLPGADVSSPQEK